MVLPNTSLVSGLQDIKEQEEQVEYLRYGTENGPC